MANVHRGIESESNDDKIRSCKIRAISNNGFMLTRFPVKGNLVLGLSNVR